MGVHGITSFLEEQNIMPQGSDECCSTKLWKDWNPSMAFLNKGPNLTLLPPKSTLFIDGNGLAFHLNHVAYARYVQATFASRRGKSCPKLNALSDIDIAKAIPSMVPLDLVRQVTVEFVTTLEQFDLKLKCYWDGPALGGFKARTLTKRKAQRDQDWSSLQTFCQHGTVPMKPSESICQCIWKFPLARLFLQSVKHALRSCSVEMVQCDGEADVELARSAQGNLDAYVLGQDSDFLFYEGIQYVPFGGIYLSTGLNACVQAVCLTRRKIAKAIGLDDEDMVELAILLGNDYVDPKSLRIPTDCELRNVRDCILYLKQNADDDFLVQSKNDEAPELDYVRSLYSLSDTLDSYLLHDSSDDDSSAENDAFEEVEECMLSLPEDFPWELAQVGASDKSLHDVVTTCLQAFADQCAGDDGERSMILRQAHVDAYKAATALTMSPGGTVNSVELSKRPRWNDVCAAFLVDACISRALRVTSDSFLLTSHTPPHTLMNHLRFHQFLGSMNLEGDCNDNASTIVSRNDSQTVQPEPSTSDYVERPVLPIDEHEEKIISNIQQHRVTIIHGETGCGKSSRVPVMILESPSPEPSLPRVKMFISQPRRIAAASLVERVRSCEPDHRDKFALRMGHGHREYESSRTQAWFVTTGYLTRLLANHPERFNDVTHLIIDEVHERSVDTDILCLLCRRLLETNTMIRLVLMSATMASKLYQDYFKVPHDPIHVGVRRFPIQEFFVEDLHKFDLPHTEVAAATAIQKECETKRCNSPPSATELSKRFVLAARLTTAVGVPGSSVLIFVPGMGEIIAITEAIEKIYRPGIVYVCYPIHSEIPFEEQMGAFDAPSANEVKVIIATNAAESSVTLPAVDHVICLGLSRQIMYNPLSHRQILTPCWISKASATQRAGRTGRLRPGNVYRLYTRHAYEHFMDEFEQGEMVRIPLDSVILMLKEILHEEAKPVLMSCIEPPRIETIEKSFESLYQWSFLSEPNDSSDITTLGSFVSALGIDLALGFLIGLGIQFGVAAEAIEMAAVMSFPKSPFQISNPLIHSASTYNETTVETYVSRCHFDANLYSEPLALMNALWDYHIAHDRTRWCTFYRFAHARMRQLHSTRDSLRKRVAVFLGINEARLQVAAPPVHMPHYKLTILRILKVWVFSDTILESRPTKLNWAPNGAVTLTIPKNQTITEAMLDQLLMKDRHPYQILERRSMDGMGTFQTDDAFSLSGSVEETLQSRFVSYMCAVDMDVAILKDQEHTYAYFRNDVTGGPMVSRILDQSGGEVCLLQGENDPNTKRRGILERKCGLWKITSIQTAPETLHLDKHNRLRLFQRVHKRGGEDLSSIVSQGLVAGEINSLMIFHFLDKKKQKKRKTQLGHIFMYTLKGQCKEISKGDMQDLLAVQTVELLEMTTTTGKSIIFPHKENTPRVFNGKGSELMATTLCGEDSSWARPIFTDIPEGARVVSVLASGQRKGNCLKFPDVDADEEDATIDITLVAEETDIGQRWRRVGAERFAYVGTETVPASATSSEFPLFACCSNTLEVRGGGIRVEGMTILPPNPIFLLLCRLSFGLGPDIDMNFGSMAKLSSGADLNEAIVHARAKHWLEKRMEKVNLGMNSSNSSMFVHLSSYDQTEKILEAVDFHKSCASMGENLVCFPDRTRALVKLFNGVEEHQTAVDDSLEERGLTPENLAIWRQEAPCGIEETEKNTPRTIREPTHGPNQAQVTKNSKKTIQAANTGPSPNTVATPKTRKNTSSEERQLHDDQVQPRVPLTPAHDKWRIVRNFDKDTRAKVANLFITELDDNQQLESISFPSTNILALLVQQFVLMMSMNDPKTPLRPMENYVDLTSKNWEILTHENDKPEILYRAKYKNRALPTMALFGRGKNKLPKWMRTNDPRPRSIEEAMACVPPSVTIPEPKLVSLSKGRQGLAYESIEAALQMEAAFFLELQFAVASKSSMRHWYHQTLDAMINILSQSPSIVKSSP